MPRTLPWLTGGAKVKREPDLPAPAIKRTSGTPVKNETASKNDSTFRKHFLRSSPSPPSSPIHRCPSEEFLREGLDKDDIYIMVEDEFYTVAQTFTRHLHYAEYLRRKKEAKLHNADTIADIARPTNGVAAMNAELKKYAADELKARQKDGLDAVLGKQPTRGEDAGDDLEAEASWAGTPLQNFMISPRRVRSLAGLQKLRPSTRAAAGFSQSSGLGSDPGVGEGPGDDGLGKDRKGSAIIDETTDDDDDLDAGVSQTNPTIARSSNTPSNSGLLWCTPSAFQFSKLNGLPSEGRLDDVGERQSPVSKQRNNTLSSGPPRRPSLMRSPCEHRPTEAKKEQATRPKDILNTTPAKRRFVFDDSDENFTPSSDSLRRSSSLMLLSGQNRLGGIKKELEATKPKDIRHATQDKRGLGFDDSDELPEPRKPSIQAERQSPLFTNTKQQELKNKDTMLKKSRLNEVPTFLV
ncbi:hypothetical protein BDV10DRAFT_68408 [Aspergillus recurvatus]